MIHGSRYHELKIDPDPFICVSLDQKRAEFRKNDRDFKVYDTLILREYDVFHGYTGSYELRYITHIQEGYGITEGYVMLSMRPLTRTEKLHVCRDNPAIYIPMKGIPPPKTAGDLLAERDRRLREKPVQVPQYERSEVQQ